MKASEVRKFTKAEPFEPFEIELESGRILKVNRADFIAVPPARGDTGFGWADPKDFTLEVFNTRQIVAVRKQGSGRNRRRRKAA